MAELTVQVKCPQCDARIAAVPGDHATCPNCGFASSAPPPSPEEKQARKEHHRAESRASNAAGSGIFFGIVGALVLLMGYGMFTDAASILQEIAGILFFILAAILAVGGVVLSSLAELLHQARRIRQTLERRER